MLRRIRDFLGALTAGCLESGTGDVGESFCLAAVLFGVFGDGEVNGEGSEDPFQLRGGVWVVADSRVVAPEHVAGDKSVALGFVEVVVNGLQGR